MQNRVRHSPLRGNRVGRSPLRGNRVGRSPLRDQKTFAASLSASNSCRSRKFSNHSKTSKKPVLSRSVRPRNSARSLLQLQRDLRVNVAFMTRKRPIHSGTVKQKVFIRPLFVKSSFVSPPPPDPGPLTPDPGRDITPPIFPGIPTRNST